MTRNINPFASPEHQYGTTLESLLERRERVAKSEGANYGAGKMFAGLTERVLKELPAKGGKVLEVDAGAGLFTRMLLAAGHEVTAIEPAPLLCKKLEEINGKELAVHCGFIEDMSFDDDESSEGEDDAPLYDSAVVTFPARRGRGILALICELLPLVKDKVMLILPDDGSVDWTSTLRAISLKGYHATAEFVVDNEALENAQRTGKFELGQMEVGQIKRTMLMTIYTTPRVENPLNPAQVITAWGASIRCIEVPYPVPRGAATRLVRYFKAGGDRSILIKTEPAGMHHLYGNLRTAAHRLARDQITVRRVDEGIQLMQIIQSEIKAP
ncbi:MAG: hypothetical protein FWE48_00720 [Coriobacteriia bacterium]|nr:hypothetical protein [Coriobacteriia bacterium]MCL2745605.1 hypothetical protein [Coriobacteriia bacterium]MCL2871316.1 hypothetical protein [Coriobacteriia bacterium]